MAFLKEISETAYNQVFPNAKPDAPIKLEHFIVTAKVEFAIQMWKMALEEKAREGEFNVPSELLTEVELPIDNGKMDLSGQNILRSLSNDGWIQNVGGTKCTCLYVKTTINRAQLLCDDDSLPDDAKTYYPQGDFLVFPKGVHKSPLIFIYANNGKELDDDFEIDDRAGALVRSRLIDIYAGKTGKEDVSQNSNSQV